MWRYNFSYFLSVVLLFACEVPYITSIVPSNGVAWLECANPFYLILWALPGVASIVYISARRLCIPKAPKDTRGIAFCVINASEKQQKDIYQKLIKPFAEVVNTEMPGYSVVTMDEYHSRKFYPLLSKNDARYRPKQNKLLEKRGCRAAILIDYTSGNDGDALFCRMKLDLRVVYKDLPVLVEEFLIKDISNAFLPLRKLDVTKLGEIVEMAQHSSCIGIVCQYILASTCYHIGDFSEAVRLLEIINNIATTLDSIPKEVAPIISSLNYKIAISYRLLARCEYGKYCDDCNEVHLHTIRNAISNKYCKQIFEKDNKILEGICFFALDGNIKKALQCMDQHLRKDPVIKYNKAFLFMYDQCSSQNVSRTYSIYKSFGELPIVAKKQIEAFTFHEYEKDRNKKQLLWILFFVYDYQGNTVLAKRCLEQFCEAFPWVLSNKDTAFVHKLIEKYSGVQYDETEEYSI